MYQAIYKCRLCGEVFNQDRLSNNEVNDLLSENCHDIWAEHKCNGNASLIGIADIQGFKKVGE